MEKTFSKCRKNLNHQPSHQKAYCFWPASTFLCLHTDCNKEKKEPKIWIYENKFVLLQRRMDFNVLRRTYGFVRCALCIKG